MSSGGYIPGRGSEGQEPDGRADEKRQARIAKLTAAGGITDGQAPIAYRRSDDWITVNSHDPFEKLYLDRRQADLITDKMVRLHRLALRRFWDDLIEEYDGGAASPAKKQDLIDRYAGSSEVQLRAWPSKVDEAADKLSDAASRRREADRLTAAEVEATREEVRVELLAAMRDQRIETDESETLLAIAVDGGWSREEAAAYVLGELERDGFRPFEPSTGSTAAARLTTVDWFGPLVPNPNAAPPPPDVELALGPFVDMALAHEELAPRTASLFFQRAEEQGIAESEAALFLQDRLNIGADDGYVLAPGEGGDGGDLADQLRSARWISRRRFEEEHRSTQLDAYRGLVAGELKKAIVSPRAIRSLLDQARGHGVKRSEAGALVFAELADRGYRPPPGKAPRGSSDTERVLSTVWLRPEAFVQLAREEDGKARTRAPEGHDPTGQSPPGEQAQEKESAAGRRRGRGLILLLASLGLTTVFLVLWADGPAEYDTPLYEVEVVALGLNVRTEPTARGGRSTVLATLQQGERVDVLEERTNTGGEPWLRIRSGSTVGWVSGRDEYVDETLTTVSSASPTSDAGGSAGDVTSGGEIVDDPNPDGVLNEDGNVGEGADRQVPQLDDAAVPAPEEEARRRQAEEYARRERAVEEVRRQQAAEDERRRQVAEETRRREQAAEPGTVRVSVRPYGSVYVDGTRRLVDVSSARPLELPPGRHTLAAEHPNLGRAERVVTVAPGQTERVEFDLRRGDVSIAARDASGAPILGEIYVDGQPTGLRSPALVRGLQLGPHRFEVRGDRVRAGPQTVEVTALLNRVVLIGSAE